MESINASTVGAMKWCCMGIGFFLAGDLVLEGRQHGDNAASSQEGTPYVQEEDGLIRAGGAGHVVHFDEFGAAFNWKVNGFPLLGNRPNPTGKWLYKGSGNHGKVHFWINPPHSFKWRSARTMAAWTVGKRSWGVILANTGTEPAVFRLSLDKGHMKRLRTRKGKWKAIEIVRIAHDIDRLQWILPDGEQILWSGTGRLYPTEASGMIILESKIPERKLVSWAWTYGRIAVIEPKPHAVYQRQGLKEGPVPLEGIAPPGTATVSFRIVQGNSPFKPVNPDPVVVQVDPASGAFCGKADWPAGGWYAVELIARDKDRNIVAQREIAPVGIGEVFVVAGQSNSTNSGQVRTRQKSGMVSTFSGSAWRPADDPMPGTHDNAPRGSFQPAMGDALFRRLGVPVGFASTGQGASAVRHWLPDYIYNHDEKTFLNGLYPWTLFRMKQLGKNGFRALLWHQGESDAARGKSRNPEKSENHYQSLDRLFSSWRADAGWEIPIFSAKASLWPVENAEFGGDPFLRAAQQQVWEEKITFPGPDTDKLGLEYRQDNSKSRVHFNKAGLVRHGQMWSEAVLPWILGDSKKTE